MKHTKGPWHIKKDYEYNRYCIDDNKGTQSEPIVELNFFDSRHSNSAANLKLIAAAPELLEACKMVLAYSRASGRGSLKGALSVIEAYLPEVISKAEGE